MYGVKGGQPSGSLGDAGKLWGGSALPHRIPALSVKGIARWVIFPARSGLRQYPGPTRTSFNPDPLPPFTHRA
jgi:hypothetical protein